MFSRPDSQYMFFSSEASVSVWIFCNSWIWIPQLSSMCKDGSQNHTVIIGKGSNTQKWWKTKEFMGPEGYFWRTAGSLTVQDKQGTHEQLSLNKKTSGGPLSALTCCVNARLLSAIKKISPLIYSQSWVGSWVYTTQAMMTFTLIF